MSYSNNLTDLASSENYEVLDSYTNSITKLRFLHKDCNTIFSMIPNKFIQGRRCPKCGGVQRQTTESYKKLVKEKTNNEWELTSEYINNNTPIEYTHIGCGGTTIKKPSKFSQYAFICNKCKLRFFFKEAFRIGNTERPSTIQLTKEIWQDRLDTLFTKGEYLILSDYTNSKTPVQMIHTPCGKQFSKRLDALYHHKETCIQCADRVPINQGKLTYESFEKEGYTLLDDIHTINSNKTILNLKHNECGKIYNVRFRGFFIKKHRCPHCQISGNEQEIIDFIKSIYSGPLIQHDRSILKPKELDIYLPDLNFAIEYNGSYYHSTERKGELYHQDKSIECLLNNINLLHIFDSDWTHKKNFIKQLISIQVNDTRKDLSLLYSSTIKYPTANTVTKFLKENESDSNIDYTEAIGLYYQNKLTDLILVLSEFNSSNSIIIQYIQNKTLKSSNGFSILIKELKSRYTGIIKFFYTKIDLRYYNATIYENNDWTLQEILPPKSIYIQNNTYIESTRISNLDENYNVLHTPGILVYRFNLVTNDI